MVYLDNIGLIIGMLWGKQTNISYEYLVSFCLFFSFTILCDESRFGITIIGHVFRSLASPDDWRMYVRCLRYGSPPKHRNKDQEYPNPYCAHVYIRRRVVQPSNRRHITEKTFLLERQHGNCESLLTFYVRHVVLNLKELASL